MEDHISSTVVEVATGQASHIVGSGLSVQELPPADCLSQGYISLSSTE